MSGDRDRAAGHDVVIVGGGAAGCLIARRLTDAGLDVAVIEAGPGNARAEIEDAGRALELPFGELDWRHLTVGQEALGSRRVPCAAGRVLGGSGSINNTIYVRGSRGDYARWAAATGDDWWDWENVLQRFRALEDFDGGSSELRGAGGPIHITSDYRPNPIMDAFVEAAESAGLPRNPDFNSGSLEGVGNLQFNIDDGVRRSSASALLAAVAGAPNLTVRTDCLAHRLLFAGERCIGVEVETDGRIERIEARQEVILSAGPIGSPQLLMLSGIGPAEHLREVGVEPLVDLPAVGANLQDHVLAVATYAGSRPVPPPPPRIPPYQAAAFARSRADLVSADLQFQAVQFPFIPGVEEMPEHGFTLMTILNRPQSRGNIRLAAADPLVRPLIDPRYLSEPADTEALAAGLELAREIFAQAPLAEWLEREISPGPTVGGRAELRTHLRDNSWSFYHPAGTCAMGSGEDSVLDPQLRVRGTQGLRVADASAMPTIPGANTHAPTLMIGERAADLVARSA